MTQITKLIDPPPLLGGIAGDIVHNLRCAFDLIASEIVGGNNRSGIFFPVFKDSKIYNIGKLKSATKDALDLVESYQPFYSQSNDDLWRIHKMDIWDKHRIITTVAVGMPRYKIHTVSNSIMMPMPDGTLQRVNITAPSAKEPIVGFLTVPIKNDFIPKCGEYIGFPISPPLDDFRPELVFVVALEKTADWDGEEALPALERLYAYTDKAIKDFSSLFSI